ncbi:MAG: hypothetical protein AB1420_15875 [Bacillota bacterium]
MDNKKKAKECWKNACYRHWWYSEYRFINAIAEMLCYAITGIPLSILEPIWQYVNPYYVCPHCYYNIGQGCTSCSVKKACKEYKEVKEYYQDLYPEEHNLLLMQYCYEKWKGWR